MKPGKAVTIMHLGYLVKGRCAPPLQLASGGVRRTLTSHVADRKNMIRQSIERCYRYHKAASFKIKVHQPVHGSIISVLCVFLYLDVSNHSFSTSATPTTPNLRN